MKIAGIYELAGGKTFMLELTSFNWRIFVTGKLVDIKASVCYYLSKFYFPLNDSPSKTMKFFFISSKSSFPSRDILIFVFPSSRLFLPVSHSFRDWSKINLKVYNVINCPDKNLTNFVWYLEKEKRYDIEICPLIEY